MAYTLPYMFSTGLIPKILEKLQNARRPERFTQDFLETKLGHSGGSARAIIPLLKRMGFLGSDGIPTPLYDKFRNSETEAYAVAKGLKTAYSEVFDRNEYAHDLSREKLLGLIVEITGSTKSNRTTQAIVGTFCALNELADFDATEINEPSAEENIEEEVPNNTPNNLPTPPQTEGTDDIELRVGYTINLNLPETTDPEVFNAIFKALRQNLLKS